MDVVKTCMRDSRDLMRKGGMRIGDEIKVTNRGCGRER